MIEICLENNFMSSLIISSNTNYAYAIIRFVSKHLNPVPLHFDCIILLLLDYSHLQANDTMWSKVDFYVKFEMDIRVCT